MNKTWQIPRRTFLKGLGTVIALPMLEAMLPPAKVLAAGATEADQTFPRRMAFIYIPNGANMEDWTPKSVGADYELPYRSEERRVGKECRAEWTVYVVKHTDIRDTTR